MTAPIVRRKLVIACPCGETEWAVQHCVDDALERGAQWTRDEVAYGPWPCSNPACDTAVKFGVTRSGEIVHITTEPRGHGYGYALLQFRDLWIVVSELQPPDYEDSRDYFYHSHQCPTNVLHNAEAVFDARGSDPHGRLRYVASIPWSPETGKAVDEGMSLQAVLALFKTDGQPAETDWPEEDGGVLPFIAEIQREYAKSRSPKA